MNPAIKFYEKLMKNNDFVQLLSCMNGDTWDGYTEEDCKDFVYKLFDILNEVYPELGKCSVDFECMGEGGQVATAVDNKIVINPSILKSNKFDVLSSALHELRHIHQNAAIDMYRKNGFVHELFKEEDLKEMIVNDRKSCIGSLSNYIDTSSAEDLYFYEYMVQPLEMDAERFACQFIVEYMKEAELSKEDETAAMQALSNFNYALDLFLNGKDDFIWFGNIYKLNYLDKTEENSMLYREGNVKYRRYMAMYDDLDNLDENQVLELLSMFLWTNYDDETKLNILNKYIELVECDIDVKMEDDKVYINDKECYSGDVVEILEAIYNEMADNEINRIVNSRNVSRLNQIEKEVCLNLKNKENIIKKEEHPFLYFTQPYMIYKNKYIYDRINKAYMIDSLMCDYDKKNVFTVYAWYLSKYDTNTVMKKVEVMMGMSFNEYYKKMIGKMKKVKAR